MRDEIELKFIKQSNLIEREPSVQALNDALTAWDVAKKIDSKLKISDVLFVHLLLLQNLRADIAGNFRQCSVWIGGKKKLYISDEALFSQVKSWVALYNLIVETKKDSTVSEKEEACKKNHIDFEHIHPFVDGNGRVGRLFYNKLRLELGLDIHVIHADIEYTVDGEQASYYKWFQ